MQSKRGGASSEPKRPGLRNLEKRRPFKERSQIENVSKKPSMQTNGLSIRYTCVTIHNKETNDDLR